MNPVHELQQSVAKHSAEVVENTTRELQRLVAKFSAEVVELAVREARRQLSVAFGALPKTGEPDPIKSRIIECVQARPGLHVEQINAALGISEAELAQLLSQLVGDYVLDTKGSRQGIKYYLLGGVR